MPNSLPIKQLLFYLVLYGAGFAVMAKTLPATVFFPAAVVVAGAHLTLVDFFKRRRYERIVHSLRGSHLEGVSALLDTKRGPIDVVMAESLREVTSELEKKCYQLVEKNIQLLSLKEISLSIISSLNESRIVDSVRSYLSKGLGFKEILVGIVDPTTNALHLHTFREFFGDTSQRDMEIPLSEVQGLLRKAVLARKPILIRDPEMHPMGGAKGGTFFADSTMQSYLLVPMIKSKYSPSCGRADSCILKRHSPSMADVSNLDEARCSACGKLPVLGVIGVTDGFKAASLSQVDLVAVETLALQISTLLENSQLYAELKKEEGFRENVINSMLNGLITVDTQGRVLLVNETAERLTGYTAAELKEKNIDEIIVDNLSPSGKGPVLRYLPTGEKPQQQNEVWLVIKDGTKLPIILNTSFLLDANKVVQGALAVFIDITRIKRMEQKILHLDKLAALGRFSSSMAHEIRNPLAGIVAGLQYLRRAGSIPEDQSENLAFIHKEVDRIDRLITDILNVVRTGDLNYESSYIEKLLEVGITSLRKQAFKKGVRIATAFPEKTRPIAVDVDRITQVMINLLKNAIEASTEGGEVRVKVSFPLDVNGASFDEIQNLVIIEVQDDGVGFTEEEKSRIYEPFYTTKKDGTGLGLYVAYSIIERHGGYVFVESEKDKGSTFTVYLPVEKVAYGDASKVSHPFSR